MVPEHDKKYQFLSKFILHEAFVTETVDEIHLLIIYENEVELLTNVLPWTPVEPAKQHLILLLKTVKFWGIDILTDVEIEIESKLKDLEIKGCQSCSTLENYYQEKKNFQQLYQNLLRLGLLRTFKSSAKFGKTFNSGFQKWYIE